MTAHSRIGASSMHRWSTCPASVRLSEGMPNVSSKYAEEGTLAHECAAEYLEWVFFGKMMKTFASGEMREAIDVYTDAIIEAAKGVTSSDESANATVIFIEKKFDLSKLHPKLFGTSDAIIYHKKIKTLQVWDYKHGAGIPVEVEENEQLMYYALGALMELNLPCEWIEMVIVQPRCEHKDGPVRKWKIHVTRLIDFAADLIEAALRTEDPNAPVVPGDHCRFCPAVSKCPALEEKSLTAAKEEFSPLMPYQPEKLAKTLAIIPTIEAWIKGVEEFAYSEALAGRIPPGYKLVNKVGRRKWKDVEKVEGELLLNLGLSYDDVRAPAPLKSPAQIEKLLKGPDKKLLEELTVKESSGLTLAPESDKRQAAKPDALTEFTVINE